MGILSWIILGLLAGILAKWIMPGKDGGGMVITILLGIAGAFICQLIKVNFCKEKSYSPGYGYVYRTARKYLYR